MQGTFYASVTKSTARYPVYQVVIAKAIATEMKLERGQTVKVTIETVESGVSE